MRSLALILLCGGACAFDPHGLSATGGVADAGANAKDAANPGTPDGSVPTDAPVADAHPAGTPDAHPAPPDAHPPHPDARPPDARPDARPDAAPGSFCDPTDTNLVACYRFEISGAIAQPHDESSFHNDGTSMNATFPTGRDGKALGVGPTSDVRVPDSASLDVPSAITIEMWVRPDAIPMTGRAGLLDDDGQYGLFLFPHGVVECSLAGQTVDSPQLLAAGTFAHVACTFDALTITVYVNGVPVATKLAPGATIVTSGTNGIALGENSPNGDHLTGLIDDVRIFRRARSPAEICADAAVAICPAGP